MPSPPRGISSSGTLNSTPARIRSIPTRTTPIYSAGRSASHISVCDDLNRDHEAPNGSSLDTVVLPPFDATALRSGSGKLIAGSADDQSRQCWTVCDKPLRTSTQSRRSSSNPETSEHRRVHYRIVYGELGVSVLRLTKRRDMFQAIVGALNALDILHRLGYVHRDVNCENILLFTREGSEPVGVLTDLECAGKILEPGRHKACTGTPYFMSIEVAAQQYAFTSRRIAHVEPFIYNPLHDIESIWWLCVWCIAAHFPAPIADRASLSTFMNKLFSDRRHVFHLEFEKYCRDVELSPPILAALSSFLEDLHGFYRAAEFWLPPDASGFDIVHRVPAELQGHAQTYALELRNLMPSIEAVVIWTAASTQ